MKTIKIKGLKISVKDSNSKEKILALLNSMEDLVTSIDNCLSKLEEQIHKKELQVKKYITWKRDIFKKLNILLHYVNENSDDDFLLPNMIHLIGKETENRYNMEISEYMDLYRCEFGISPNIKIQIIDVINHYDDTREMFTSTLDSIMEKLHIAEDSDCNENNRARNIFDELAAKIKNDL